jgi:hypothetical protein
MTGQRAASKLEGRRDDKFISRSDDECVRKLAALIELRDSRDIAEIASLIGRLAIPVVLPGL